MKFIVQSQRYRNAELVDYVRLGNNKYVRVRWTNLKPHGMYSVNEYSEKLIPWRDVIRIYNPFYDKIWNKIKSIFRKADGN